jgi:hypothetical protein
MVPASMFRKRLLIINYWVLNESWRGAVDEFGSHIAGLVALGILLQEIGKEEDLQDDKYNKQFNKDNRPKRFP